MVSSDPKNDATASAAADISKNNETMPPSLKEAIFFDYCSYSQQKMIDLANSTYEDRLKASTPISKVKAEEVLRQEPMSLCEHVVSTLFLACGVPVGIFNIPILLYLIGRFVVGRVGLVFQLFGVFVLLPLATLPQKFIPELLQSWLSICMVKYFSWKYVMEEFPNPNRPRVCFELWLDVTTLLLGICGCC